MCSTSLIGMQFAMQLKEQHDKETREAKTLNKVDLREIEKDGDAKKQVGEIDYAKHEQTVKQIERDEELEERARKAADAATWCPLQHEHGPNCIRPRGDCSHNHQKEIAIYERTTVEKIKAAKNFREAGNKLFKEQNYGLACVEYRKGLLQYDYTFPEGNEETKAVEDAKLSLFLNLAACKLHLDDFKEALNQCRQALSIDPNCAKALYRKGLSHMALFDYDDAKIALEEALEIEPSNKTIHSALHELREKMIEYNAKTKKMTNQMINNPDEMVDDEKSPKKKTAVDTIEEIMAGAKQNIVNQASDVMREDETIDDDRGDDRGLEQGEDVCDEESAESDKSEDEFPEKQSNEGLRRRNVDGGSKELDDDEELEDSLDAQQRSLTKIEKKRNEMRLDPISYLALLTAIFFLFTTLALGAYILVN